MGRAYVSTAYSNSTKVHPFVKVIIVVISIVLFGVLFDHHFTPSLMFKLSSFAKPKVLRLVTWNIAAINNNPFEYWITSNDEGYNNIMKSVSNFIETPGDKDVQVKNVFTDAMADDLFQELVKIGWAGVDETKARWQSEYRDRRIISEFIKDGVLGKKRLASMPDRVTNTINS